MPACDSSAIRQLLKQTLEQPNAETDNLRVLKLTSVGDVSTAFTPEEKQARPDRRRCVAETYTNAGHGLVVFQIDWTDAARNDLYLETLASTF